MSCAGGGLLQLYVRTRAKGVGEGVVDDMETARGTVPNPHHVHSWKQWEALAGIMGILIHDCRVPGDVGTDVRELGGVRVGAG